MKIPEGSHKIVMWCNIGNILIRVLETSHGDILMAIEKEHKDKIVWLEHEQDLFIRYKEGSVNVTEAFYEYSDVHFIESENKDANN